MSKALSRAEVAALADDLRKMLATIESGDLDASTAMRHRIEGALAGLEVVLGRSTGLALDLQDLCVFDTLSLANPIGSHTIIRVRTRPGTRRSSPRNGSSGASAYQVNRSRRNRVIRRRLLRPAELWAVNPSGHICMPSPRR